MTVITVGDPSEFAIQSGLMTRLESIGQLGIGYFVIFVAGTRFGVSAPDATLLACSFHEVARRIARRGTHTISIGEEADSRKIVRAVRAALYDENRNIRTEFGISRDELYEQLASKEIVWAPDGDEAFDDGSHVLHFDRGDQVRLIAFVNHSDDLLVEQSVKEVSISSEKFYDLLSQWHSDFRSAWSSP